MASNFHDDLRASESDDLIPFWTAAFKARFPEMANCIFNYADNQAQRKGIDCLLFMNDGSTVRLDQKNDKYPPNNFFLEFVSVIDERKPGWIAKNLDVEYIAYGFINHGKCYMLCWRELRSAWKRHRAEWCKKYKVSDVPNNGYMTRGVAVPVPVVLAAMRDVQAIEVAA